MRPLRLAALLLSALAVSAAVAVTVSGSHGAQLWAGQWNYSYPGVVGGFAAASRLDAFESVFDTPTVPIGIVVAATIACFVGWLDEVRKVHGTGVSAPAKTAGLVVAGSVLTLAGVSTVFFRVPFLGNPVLDLVLGWPAEVHFDSGGGKALLRAIARRVLPQSVWGRPKHGFSVPVQEFFNGAWREVGDAHFARAAEIAPYLDANALRRLWQGARRGRASRRLAYTMLVLLVWLDRYRVEFG